MVTHLLCYYLLVYRYSLHNKATNRFYIILYNGALHLLLDRSHAGQFLENSWACHNYQAKISFPLWQQISLHAMWSQRLWLFSMEIQKIIKNASHVWLSNNKAKGLPFIKKKRFQAKKKLFFKSYLWNFFNLYYSTRTSIQLTFSCNDIDIWNPCFVLIQTETA